MRRLAACCLLWLAAAAPASAPMPSGVAALVRAYPDRLAGFDGQNLVWRDGTRMPVDDGQPNKSFQEMQRHGSILDQMRQPYPAGADPYAPPDGPEDDPGRIRNRAFFDKLYGDCRRGEVAPQLVPVTWLPRSWGRPVMITSANGVAAALQAVSEELDSLPESEARYLHPLGGTYVCRAIADSGEPSMHGYGAAIDINVALSDYWLWEKGAGPRHRTPATIIAAFERHGFIWGGRWAHYDTMHFEYRPELLPPTH